jgi:hypothetical protein
MTNNLKQNDDEISSFERNIKSLGRDLVKKDIKGNQVVKKRGKMTLLVRGIDSRTWYAEKRER